MLIKETDFKENVLQELAEEMCIAARTAPKAKGIDLISVGIANGETIQKLVDQMTKIHKEQGGSQSYLRDAESIKDISHVVLIGTRLEPLNIKACGLCGYKDCASKPKDSLCQFNAGDLGIAVGSALSLATDHRVDNRIMLSVGRAAMELGLLGKDVKIAFGIPLSATGKNTFFDRK